MGVLSEDCESNATGERANSLGLQAFGQTVGLTDVDPEYKNPKSSSPPTTKLKPREFERVAGWQVEGNPWTHDVGTTAAISGVLIVEFSISQRLSPRTA